MSKIEQLVSGIINNQKSGIINNRQQAARIELFIVVAASDFRRRRINRTASSR